MKERFDHHSYEANCRGWCILIKTRHSPHDANQFYFSVVTTSFIWGGGGGGGALKHGRLTKLSTLGGSDSFRNCSINPKKTQASIGAML